MKLNSSRYVYSSVYELGKEYDEKLRKLFQSVDGNLHSSADSQQGPSETSMETRCATAVGMYIQWGNYKFRTEPGG